MFTLKKELECSKLVEVTYTNTNTSTKLQANYFFLSPMAWSLNLLKHCEVFFIIPFEFTLEDCDL